jgi:tetratricopeptide (TPR) repeat protein
MNRVAHFCIILLLNSMAVYAGSSALPWRELNIQPLVETKTDSKIRLLPEDDELTDTNAVSLYQKAIESLPKDFNPQKFSDWRKLPSDLEQLPVTEIESELAKLKPTIDLLNQASRSKQCNWPVIKPEQAQQRLMDDLVKFRQFAYILDVEAKIQIAQGKYDSAIETLKTNIKMANQLGNAPTLIQAMIGISIGAISLERIEQLIQSDKSPDLYSALQNLPQPLMDANKAMKIEIDNLDNYNFIVRSQFRKTLEPAHEQVRKQMNYIDRKNAALQIIEALRLYAGKHEGKFPEKLSDITNIGIPNDPVTKKPFEYKSTGTEATLQIEGTEASDGRDSVRYELKLKK